MKKMITMLAAGAALVALAGVAQAKNWTEIRIATEGAYPPWNNKTAAGTLEGFEVDLAKVLCEHMKAKCTVVDQDWDGMIPALEARKYDAIMAGMSITEEREKKIQFAGPYANDPTVFAAEAKNKLAGIKVPVQRVELGKLTGAAKKAMDTLKADLKGKVIGVQTSTTQQNMVQKFFPDSTIRTYDKLDDIVLDLNSGRIDTLLADGTATDEVVKNSKGAIKIYGPGFYGDVLGVGVGVGIRKQDSDLKAEFNKAIASATKDGTIKKLSMKWFGYDVSVHK